MVQTVLKPHNLDSAVKKNLIAYNNVTFGVESSQSRSHVTTINHNFTSSGLTSITALGHLRHWVGGAWFLLIYTTE